MRRLPVLLSCALLSGCATIYAEPAVIKPTPLQNADLSTVRIDVQYDIRYDLGYDHWSYGPPTVDAATEAREEAERRARLLEMLQGYGFSTGAGPAEYVLKVTEGGPVTELDSVLMLLVTSFSMLTIPSPETSSRSLSYELLHQGAPLIDVATHARTKRIFGLLGLALAPINITGAVDRSAIETAHEGVITMWIDQGAFE